MRIRSWPNLITALFVTSGLIWNHVTHRWENWIVEIVLWAEVARAIYLTFSRDGYERSKKRAAFDAQYRRAHFGRLSRLMAWIPLAGLCLAWGVAMLLPAWKWLIAALMLVAVGDALWELLVVRPRIQSAYEQTE